MTDHFLKSDSLYDRLLQRYKQHNKIVIAYDLDDTVRPFSPECKNTGCIQVQELLREYIPYADFIVYTSNMDMEGNIKFLEENNLPYHAINENLPYIKYTRLPNKIHYNVFLDDKAGLKEVYETLEKLLRTLKKGML